MENETVDEKDECSRLASRVEELEGLLKLSAARFHTCAKWLRESKSEGWAGEATNWARQAEIDALAGAHAEEKPQDG